MQKNFLYALCQLVLAPLRWSKCRSTPHPRLPFTFSIFFILPHWLSARMLGIYYTAPLRDIFTHLTVLLCHCWITHWIRPCQHVHPCGCVIMNFLCWVICCVSFCYTSPMPCVCACMLHCFKCLSIDIVHWLCVFSVPVCVDSARKSRERGGEIITAKSSSKSLFVAKVGRGD